MIISRIDQKISPMELSQKIQKALSWLKETDLYALPVGRAEIDGERMFASVQSYKTRPEKDIFFENHEKYIDVQYLLEGEEKILLTDRSHIGNVTVPYSEENDITFYEDPDVPPHELLMRKGNIAVFLPEDCHKTQCTYQEEKDVRKIIVKVRIEEKDMQKMKLDHLCVRVRDYEESKKFYTEVLGARVDTEWKHHKGFMACFLELNGGGMIEMLGSGKDELRPDFEEVSGSYIHIAIEVENVEEAVENALKHGATPKGEIKDNTIPYPLHIGAVYGLSGEIIEFLKYNE